MNEYSLGYSNVKALQELLCSQKADSDSDNEDLPQAGARKLGPDEIKAPNGPGYANLPAPIKDEKDDEIWHASEASAVEVVEDPRKVPEYEMKFKQAVSTEDVYFGLGFKTTGTASCEWLVILVKLPLEVREKIELSVESDKIDLRSPMYRLQLPTPFSVDPNSSSAKWHQDSWTLEVTLKLQRELDDINF